MTLEEATRKLDGIAHSLCHCNVCKHAARLANEALMQVSPSGDALLLILDRDTEEFREAERKFHEDELMRLMSTLAYINRGRCLMFTPKPLKLDTPPLEKIPSLPYQQGLSDAIERYRKYTTRRIEMKPKPRIPGTYVIK